MFKKAFLLGFALFFTFLCEVSGARKARVSRLRSSDEKFASLSADNQIDFTDKRSDLMLGRDEEFYSATSLPYLPAFRGLQFSDCSDCGLSQKDYDLGQMDQDENRSLSVFLRLSPVEPFYPFVSSACESWPQDYVSAIQTDDSMGVSTPTTPALTTVYTPSQKSTPPRRIYKPKDKKLADDAPKASRNFFLAAEPFIPSPVPKERICMEEMVRENICQDILELISETKKKWVNGFGKKYSVIGKLPKIRLLLKHTKNTQNRFLQNIWQAQLLIFKVCLTCHPRERLRMVLQNLIDRIAKQIYCMQPVFFCFKSGLFTLGPLCDFCDEDFDLYKADFFDYPNYSAEQMPELEYNNSEVLKLCKQINDIIKSTPIARLFAYVMTKETK